MAKLTRFPLEMANGTKVRSIEELRENADVKSIVAYFLDGRLERWCSAWRYDGLPEKFENVTTELIKNIYDVLEITVDVQEIEAYVKENSTHMSSKPISYTETEEPLTDSEEVKNKLRAYMDASVSLSDYSIEVTPIEAENGKLCKYKISIANEKTEQYVSFVLPYDVNGGYTKRHFEDDLYKKIANALMKQHDMHSYNGMKNSRYAGLQRGDTFEFGIYEGKPITWVVLTNKDGKLLVLSEHNLCERKFGGSIWKDSEIRRWLNNDFYHSAFNTGEKEFIQCCERTNIDNTTHFKIIKEPNQKPMSNNIFGNIFSIIVIDDIPCKVLRSDANSFDIKTKDQIFLLSGFEVEYYLNDDLKDRKCLDGSWWISSTKSSQSLVYIVCGENLIERVVCFDDGNVINSYDSSGVRPAFWLKY